MATKLSDPLLTLARTVILIVQTILGIAAAALIFGIPFVIFGRGIIIAEIQKETGAATATFPSLEIAAVMALGLAIVVLSFLFLRYLRRIVDTVGEGDPFIPVNAERLTAMAWMMVAVQVLALAILPLIIRVQTAFEETRPSLETDVDIGGIVLAITLFILARVFRHGAAMRADLEGTV